MRARGLCESHYKRLRKYGDPHAGRRALPRGLPREDYFWDKVNLDGPIPEHRPELGPCWVWTGATDEKGYGEFWTGDRTGTHRAHRWAYIRYVEPLADDEVPDHLCLNHGCVRYDGHLERVSGVENVMRGTSFAVTNQAKTHCVNDHELTEGNSYGYRGRRQCKTCARDAARERYWRLRGA